MNGPPPRVADASAIAPEVLRERAAHAGIAHEYTGFWGAPVEVPPEVLADVLAAMGTHNDATCHVPKVVTAGEPCELPLPQAGTWALHDLDAAAHAPACLRGEGAAADLPGTLPAGYYRLQADGVSHLVLVAPRQCWLPEGLRQGARWWGLTTQMYALRSENSWGIGDFSDLARCASLAAAHGAAFVGTSPLHAMRTGEPESASPYSPSSRLALNTIHIDVTAVPGYAHCHHTQALVGDPTFQARLAAAQRSPTVAYGEVSVLKQAALTQLWRGFCESAWEGDGAAGSRFDRFRAENEATLGCHARFEAIQTTLQAGDPAIWGWPAWPEALRDPDAATTRDFLLQHADTVAYRYWLQWIAHEQLARAGAQARALMPVGLYCDLAVGASDGGGEMWANAELYARGMNVGAPPDPLSTQGQDWGLPPVNPVALAAQDFQPLRRLLAAVMQPAGALRMDHVMGLMRLFWTGPHGGTYVRYPLQALLAVLAIESHRHRCMVIGEDLGNVAPKMREAMAAHALLSYRPLVFERLDGGAFRPPAGWQAQALAVVSTHDLPTLAGYWAADDVAVHHALGWLEGEAHVKALLARAQDRTHLLAALDAESLLPEGVSVDAQSAPEMTPPLAAAVHALLARTPCQLVGVQLEDLTGQREQPNVPGTTDDRHPNWRRRMPVPLEHLAGHPFFGPVVGAVRAQRTVSLPAPGLVATPGGEPALAPLHTAEVPRATYRVQLHAGFTLAQARAALPYLHALGISHLYTSPMLQAAAGSTHGYDVTDPARLNAEIGTDADHHALAQDLRALDMGHLLDMVPNHMGVDDPGNPWWQEVLEHGRASPHAETFDIEWQPANPQTGARVLLPVLGDHYGRLLEAGELQLHFDAGSGRLLVRYWERSYPLDPRTYPAALAGAAMPVDAAGVDELHSLLDAFGHLPPHATAAADGGSARLRDARLLQQRLKTHAAQHAWVRDWIAAGLARINGLDTETGARRFDALDAVLQCQAYRLADWRVAGDDINYRRFFDVNSLAAIRMEDPAVFEAVHALPLQWLAEGRVNGLRIDHPDGLADPAGYFAQLQQRYQHLLQARGRTPRALYVVVEKIMAEHEPLPADWLVHGGTGYRFATLANGVFVDSDAQERFDTIYTAFTGEALPFDEAACACKRLIIETALFSDLGWLVETLARITAADRQVCDFTRNQLRVALAEVATRFPVYRTYVVPGGPAPSDIDRQHIAWAISAARRHLGTAEGGVLAYLQGILLGEDGAEPQLRARFVRRWQQFTAPVMAKAVEDTLFYRYVRLVSLNDVGAEPRRFGLSVAAFHQANLQRARHVPHGLLATSTHDSKRSEDVRARLNVLSERPVVWQRAVAALRAAAERFETLVDEQTAPSAHDRWGLFQALAGIWPAEGAGAHSLPALRERVQRYMVKAMREAKLRTNWLFPHAEYEAAVAQYIDKALASERFVAALQSLVQAIAPYGYRNSLCQLALKLTAPGVPDIYQGCEAWNFSLVDPDNRRPVDFDALAASLAPLQALYADGRWPAPVDWHAVLGQGSPAMPDAAKQLATWRLLQLRARHAPLFRDAIYLPLAVEGPAAAHALAFARIHEGQAVVVLCARLLALWDTQQGAQWEDTTLALAGAHPALARVERWMDWCTGATVDNAAQVPLQALLQDAGARGSHMPYAVLVAQDENP